MWNPTLWHGERLWVVGNSFFSKFRSTNSELEEEATVLKYRTWEEDHDGTVPGYNKELWNCLLREGHWRWTLSGFVFRSSVAAIWLGKRPSCLGLRRGYGNQRRLCRHLRQHQVGKVMGSNGTCLFVLVTWHSVKGRKIWNSSPCISRVSRTLTRGGEEEFLLYGTNWVLSVLSGDGSAEWESAGSSKVCEQYVLSPVTTESHPQLWISLVTGITWMLVSNVRTKA